MKRRAMWEVNRHVCVCVVRQRETKKARGRDRERKRNRDTYRKRENICEAGMGRPL